MAYRIKRLKSFEKSAFEADSTAIGYPLKPEAVQIKSETGW